MRIDIRGLEQSFSDRPVLEIDKFSSDSFSALAFIGPSGGGKSTLLRVLASLLIPNRGEIDVDGVRLSRESKSLRDYRKSIGVVFQGFNLFSHLSARENVILPLKHVHGLSGFEAGQRADEIFERFGLQDHANKQPGALSGGQRQRVAIARALAIRPKLLFLDEPTSALDPEMTAEVLEVLEEIKKQGGKFVIVTHAMGFARHVADNVAFLSHGKILESGKAEAFFSSPQSREVQRFLERVLRY